VTFCLTIIRPKNNCIYLVFNKIILVLKEKRKFQNYCLKLKIKAYLCGQIKQVPNTMKNTKEMMDSMVDASKETVQNWMETANHAQKNIFTGKGLENNSELYKNWLNNQMNIFRKATNETTEKNVENRSAENTAANGSMNEFFQNWYNQQMDSVKKITDFNQQLIQTWMSSNHQNMNPMMNFGSGFNPMMNSWTQTLQHSFENLSKMMNPGINKDSFMNMFATQSLVQQMQAFYQPFVNAMQTGSMDWSKMNSFIQPDQYKNIMENMFSSLFPHQNVRETFDQYVKMVHEYFHMNQDANRSAWEAFQGTMKNYPDMLTGDMGKMMSVYAQVNQTFTKVMDPFMKMMSPGKEKERMQEMLETMDKIAVYMIKQNQLQYLVYSTGNQALEASMKEVMEQYKNQKEITSFQQFFNNWVNTNEKVFTEMFGSDDYSALKAEVIALGMGVKKDMENQFEYSFSNLPLVFRSEMDELYRSVQDLRKVVRGLQDQLALYEGAETPAVATPKARKTTK